MTVGELIRKLSEIEPTKTVYLSSDEEGNHIQSLWEVEHSFMVEDGSEWYSLHPEDISSYKEDEVIEAVVLWP